MRISTAGVVRKDGAYLLALRLPGTTIGESWEFPGGKAEEGESPEEAMQREFLEEFNVRVKVGECIYTGTFTNGSKTYLQKAFLVEMQDTYLELKEHQKYSWFTPSQMTELKMADSDRKIAQHLASEKY